MAAKEGDRSVSVFSKCCHGSLHTSQTSVPGPLSLSFSSIWGASLPCSLISHTSQVSWELCGCWSLMEERTPIKWATPNSGRTLKDMCKVLLAWLEGGPGQVGGPVLYHLLTKTCHDCILHSHSCLASHPPMLSLENFIWLEITLSILPWFFTQRNLRAHVHLSLFLACVLGA